MILRRLSGAAPAALLLVVSSVAVTSGSARQSPRLAPVDCSYQAGQPLTSQPWADQQLDFRQAWPMTQGQGVLVGVIDSGVNFSLPNLTGITHAASVSVAGIANPEFDCANHGTAVAAIIAGQSADTPFSGVAPRAGVVSIKMTDGDQNSNGSAALAQAIMTAVDDHVQVANLSVYVNVPDPGVRAAVEYAQQHGVTLVCAGGNDGQQNNQPTYPAAWSGTYDNIIAVSATDQNDSASDFSESGNYIDVAAPGVAVQTPYTGGGFGQQSGTSFAAPFVTGTVALMLSAHPGLSPAQIRTRLEETADAPPASVPSPAVGYGVINPYLAVTAVQTADAESSASARPQALPPLPPVTSADRTLEHVALGVGGGLLGLALMLVVGTGVLRSSRQPGRR